MERTGAANLQTNCHENCFPPADWWLIIKQKSQLRIKKQIDFVKTYQPACCEVRHNKDLIFFIVSLIGFSCFVRRVINSACTVIFLCHWLYFVKEKGMNMQIQNLLSYLISSTMKVLKFRPQDQSSSP